MMKIKLTMTAWNNFMVKCQRVVFHFIEIFYRNLSKHHNRTKPMSPFNFLEVSWCASLSNGYLKVSQIW